MINLFFDGGCYISNPGAAAGAAVLCLANGDRVIGVWGAKLHWPAK